MLRKTLLLFLVLGLFFASLVAAGQIGSGNINAELEPVSLGLDDPVSIKSVVLPPNNVNAIILVGQRGTVRYLNAANLAAPPQLIMDITSHVYPINATYDERGLLGIAFHPQFATNGRFFLWYNTVDIGPSSTCSCDPTQWNTVLRLKEYWYRVKLSGNVRIKKRRTLLEFRKPYSNHDAVNNIEFNPSNNRLYVVTGDGGCAYDPFKAAQDTNKIYGKMLSIDVSVPSNVPFSQGYDFNCSQTLVNGTFTELQTKCPKLASRIQVVGIGLRNPGGLHFDTVAQGTRVTFVDVGQAVAEEVNSVVLPQTINQPLNFGWNVLEGDSCVDQSRNPCPNVQPPTPLPDLCSTAGRATTVEPLSVGPRSSARLAPMAAFISGNIYKGTQFSCVTNGYIFGEYLGHMYVTFPNEPSPSYLNNMLITCRNCPGGNVTMYVKSVGMDSTQSTIFVGANVNRGPNTPPSAMLLRVRDITCP